MTWRRAKNHQTIIEMDNVELIELKKSRVQCPSCLHCVFERTILCSCGKHSRSNQEMIQWIRIAFEVLKTPFFRASHPGSWCYKHGPQLWQQHHHKANDALRGATRKKDRTFVNIWDRCGKRCGIWKIAQKQWLERCVRTISRSRCTCWTTRQKDSTTIATRNEYCMKFQRKKDRKRLNDKLDPKIREYLEWLCENWEQYITKERELPTSSSSSQSSSTSWWSSHEWSSKWKGWQQHSWQDDK